MSTPVKPSPGQMICRRRDRWKHGRVGGLAPSAQPDLSVASAALGEKVLVWLIETCRAGEKLPIATLQIFTKDERKLKQRLTLTKPTRLFLLFDQNIASSMQIGGFGTGFALCRFQPLTLFFLGDDDMSIFQQPHGSASIDPDDLLLDVEDDEDEALDDVTVHFGRQGWRDMNEDLDSSF